MFSKFFINRPIFATVLALLIVVAGLVTLGILPIAQYPEITPPTVQVSAVYPGANAQTVAQTVGIPIEQQVNGVDGMLYMSSNSSSSGAYSLTITFAVGTDIDMATVQVQNRVSVAQASLPTPVVVQGVTVQKQSSNIVMFLTMTSDNKEYDGLYLSNYATLNLADQLTRVPGVGAVNVMGAGDYSMRIWLDPAALRIRNLSASDVYQAIQAQNVEVSAGTVGQPLPATGTSGNSGSPAYQYTLTVKGRLSSPEEFGNIILRTETGGRVLRLRDVAHIDLGSASYNVVSRLNGQPIAAIAIYQQPGSNSLDVSKGVRAKMQELSQSFPQGIDYSRTDTCRSHCGGRCHCGGRKFEPIARYRAIQCPGGSHQGDGRDYRPDCGCGAGVACRIHPHNAHQRHFGTTLQAICTDYCRQYRIEWHKLADTDSGTVCSDIATYQTCQISTFPGIQLCVRQDTGSIRQDRRLVTPTSGRRTFVLCSVYGSGSYSVHQVAQYIYPRRR